MNRTASLVMKIVGASLALAAVVCLIIGCWNELMSGAGCVKQRIKSVKGKLSPAEAADYADEELYE
ncbi:MAG: hypothetical protein IJE22_01085 [Oscillibacter sp.]|nr:hypothetical protein [Oscillibacter sp.]MBQ2995817.1 hypothetical protein [Oscillibacter sp.]